MRGHVLAVVLMLGLLLAICWLARRQNRAVSFLFRRSAKASELALLGALPLSHQHCLHLVAARSEVILIATYPSGVAFQKLARGFTDDLAKACAAAQERES